jgi:Protein of unknown function (DUF3224)
MPTRASGSFTVAVVPQPGVEGSPIGRMTVDKQFHGDLDATSVGEMVTTATESAGSRVYVALERVTGTLAGRSGSFVLMHAGTMTREGMSLSVTVAPASGTGALAGITGTLAITIVDKQHLYDFDYILGD